MPIEVQHQPNTAFIAGPAFGAGAEKRRQYENDLAMQAAAMAQRERMQANSIVAQQASQANQIQAGFLENMQRHAMQMQQMGAQAKIAGANDAQDQKNRLQAILAQGNQQQLAQNNAATNAMSNWNAQQQQTQTVQQARGQAAAAVVQPTPAYQQHYQQNIAPKLQTHAYSPDDQKRLDKLEAERRKLGEHVAAGRMQLSAAEAQRERIESQLMAIQPSQEKVKPQQKFDADKIDFGNGSYGWMKPDGSIQQLLPPKSVQGNKPSESTEGAKSLNTIYETALKGAMQPKVNDDGTTGTVDYAAAVLFAEQARRNAATAMDGYHGAADALYEVMQKPSQQQQGPQASPQAAPEPPGSPFTPDIQPQQQQAPPKSPAVNSPRAYAAEPPRPGKKRWEPDPFVDEQPAKEAVVVKSKADFDKLPKGASYVAPDGSVRRKS